MIRRRPVLAGMVGLFGSVLWPLPAKPKSVSPAIDIQYGWNPNVKSATEANLHVAPHGDDSADGSLERPLRTVQRGIDLLATLPSGSLAIHEGVYREAISLDALRGKPEAPYQIHRYDKDRVQITAAENLSGWVLCSEEEKSERGVSGEVYVARLPADSMEHGALHALNLHEANVWSSIAIDRADRSDPERSGDQTTYYRGIFETDTEDRVLAIQDPRLQGLPRHLMRGVEVLMHHRPNLVSPMSIQDFDPDKGRIILANPGPKLQRSAKAPVPLYALRGAPWALQETTWVAFKTSANEVSIYFKPRDKAHLARQVEISLRATCIDFGDARHVELYGIEAIRAAGADRRSGICIRRIGHSKDPASGTGLRLVHCRAGENLSVGPRGYGAIFLRDATDLTMHHVSIGPARGGFGLFLASCTDVDTRFMHIKGISNSPARFFTLRRAVIAFSHFEDSGRDAHSNKFNFYEGSDTVLVYGVRCSGVGGYVTYQEASRIHFAFCEFPCDPSAQNRALVSQNRQVGSKQGGNDGTGEPVTGSMFFYWNNSLRADPRYPKPANALLLGPKKNSQKHAYFNNVLHGGGMADIYVDRGEQDREWRSHNRYTGLSYWQAPRYGWRLGAMEEVMRFSAQPQDIGRDMRPEIERDLMPLFPAFNDWSVDIDGRPVDWEAPPIGCRTLG